MSGFDRDRDRDAGGAVRQVRAAAPGRGAGRAMAAAAVLLVLLGAALQAARDRVSGAVALPQRNGSVPPGGLVRRAALSFESVFADLYWIRAVQHYGRTRIAGGGADDHAPLHPLLDAATTLDPRFDAAYRLGAVFLAEPPPGGAGRPDLAVALLRKGIAGAPERWQYRQDIGFIHYWWRRDVEAAARWFRRAADTPGAPWWLRFLAAATMSEGGDRAGARSLWRLVHEETANAWMRGEAARRLAQLDALDTLDALDRAVDRFRARTGRPPGSWRELVEAGDLRSAPVDPAGVAYALTPHSGVVSLSPRSALHPLPARTRVPAGPSR